MGGTAQGGSEDAVPFTEGVRQGLEYWPRDFGMLGLMGRRMAEGFLFAWAEGWSQDFSCLSSFLDENDCEIASVF